MQNANKPNNLGKNLRHVHCKTEAYEQTAGRQTERHTDKTHKYFYRGMDKPTNRHTYNTNSENGWTKIYADRRNNTKIYADRRTYRKDRITDNTNLFM